MDVSYLEYTLTQCDDNVIPAVCSLYKTKSELLESASRGFNGTDYILGQGLLIRASIGLISDNGYLNKWELDNDAKIVFERCKRNFSALNLENLRHIDIDLERMFDVLVDLNWLFSSKYRHHHKGKKGLISLLASPLTVRINLRMGLKDVLYEAALYDKDRSEQYKTAQKPFFQLFNGLHPDPEVKNYYAQGYSYLDFKVLQSSAVEQSIQHMALFYALTATAAKVEQIRRMW